MYIVLDCRTKNRPGTRSGTPRKFFNRAQSAAVWTAEKSEDTVCSLEQLLQLGLGIALTRRYLSTKSISRSKWMHLGLQQKKIVTWPDKKSFLLNRRNERTYCWRDEENIKIIFYRVYFEEVSLVILEWMMSKTSTSLFS